MPFTADIGRSRAENTMLVLFNVILDAKRKADASKETTAGAMLHTG